MCVMRRGGGGRRVGPPLECGGTKELDKQFYGWNKFPSLGTDLYHCFVIRGS